jgi:hypothetical protein
MEDSRLVSLSPGRLPLCEICTGHSHKELRNVKDRDSAWKTPGSVAVDARMGGHDPPRFSGRLPGRYEHRLLLVCCPAGLTSDRDLPRSCCQCQGLAGRADGAAQGRCGQARRPISVGSRLPVPACPTGHARPHRPCCHSRQGACRRLITSRAIEVRRRPGYPPCGSLSP